MRVPGHVSALGFAAVVAAGAVSIGLTREQAPQVRPAPEAAGVISGGVENAAGGALADAKVDLRRDQTVVQTTRTNAQGLFRFEKVAAGHLRRRGGTRRADARRDPRGGDHDGDAGAAARDGDSDRGADEGHGGRSVSRWGRTRRDRGRRGWWRATGGAATCPRPRRRCHRPARSLSPCSRTTRSEPAFDRAIPDSARPRTTRSTRTASAASRTIRSRRSRSTSTPRPTRTSGGSSNEGQLPPADAVRIEELVNYFRYEYPRPAGRRAVLGDDRGGARARGSPGTGSCSSACRPGATMAVSCRRAISCSCSTCRAR